MHASLLTAELHIRCIFFTSKMPISSPNPMFDPFLESSHRDDYRDDSKKWSNIGIGEQNNTGRVD